MKFKNHVFNLNSIYRIIQYILLGFFNNVKFIALSIINIVKVIPVRNNYRIYPYENILLYYFYDIFFFCLKKFGRYKYSNHLNFKPFFIGRWFHISKLSLFPFIKDSVITIFFSWIAILIYPIISSTDINFNFLIVIFLTLFSSKYFYQLKGQNYNIIGWVFFYPFLQAISFNNTFLIYLFTIILFETSITAFFMGSIFLVFSLFFYEISFSTIFMNFIIVLPLILIRIYPVIKNENIFKLFSQVLVSVGTGSKKTHLKRAPKTINHLIFETFNILVLAIFIFLFTIKAKAPIFLIISFSFLIFNTFIQRFSDNQNINICIIICSIFSFDNISLDYQIILFYWFFIANPINESLFQNKFDGKIEKPLLPVRIDIFEKKLDNFIKIIPKNSRLFFPAEDPNGIYENIIDNHNLLLSPIAFFCLKNDIFFHPYYFSVVLDQPIDYKYWGTDLNDVLTNMKRKKFDYALIKSNLINMDRGFMEKFDIISKLDWREIFPHPFKEIDSDPIWYLLKLNNKV